MAKTTISASHGKNAAAKAVGAMTDPCRKLCDTIREFMSTLSGNEVLGSWQIGRQVNKAREDSAGYGAEAVELVATALQIEPTTLYNCGRFATTFPTSKEVKTLLARRNSIGSPIQYSHLVALSRVDDETTRNKLIEGFFTHSWSVRDLAAQIQQKLGKRGNNAYGRSGSPVPSVRSPAAAVSTLHRTLTGLIERTPQLLEQLDVYNHKDKVAKLSGEDELQRLADLMGDLALVSNKLEELSSAATTAHDNVAASLKGEDLETEEDEEEEEDAESEEADEESAEEDDEPVEDVDDADDEDAAEGAGEDDEDAAEEDAEPVKPNRVRLVKRAPPRVKKPLRKG